jgi:hypothetical protein
MLLALIGMFIFLTKVYTFLGLNPQHYVIYAYSYEDNGDYYTIRMIRSARERALSQLATPATPRERSVPNTKTGNPVPTANIAGRTTPPVDFRAKGISTIKNKVALTGQKARAERAPRGKPPIIPQSATLLPIRASVTSPLNLLCMCLV